MTSSMSKRLTIESYMDFVAVAVVARTHFVIAPTQQMLFEICHP